MTTRLAATFAVLAAVNRPAFVTYIMGGDPDRDAAMTLMRGLPAAGADIIELGMPFSDPMADGPAIQAAALRALDAGHTMAATFDMVREFRKSDDATPIILMGYYNPIYRYGAEKWLVDAKAAGIDGMIVVDLPPEMDEELCLPSLDAGLAFIRLATPTTDAKRLPKVLSNTSGFVYYVSMNGITGSAAVDPAAVAASVSHIKAKTQLPICVGFGVSTPDQAAAIGRAADGVVVGSAVVKVMATNGADAALTLVRELADGIANSRA